MSIAVFSKFVNGIPTNIFEGKDVSLVLLVNPPADLPAFFLADKGVLDTATKTIKVYDETGENVIHDFDISGTDLTPLETDIANLQGRVGDLESDLSDLESDVGDNTTRSTNNATDIGNLTQRVTTAEGNIEDNQSDISALQTTTGNINTDIVQIKIDIGNNTTEIGKVKVTAEDADALSKANKTRLDNLPPAPNLSPYIKTGDDASLSSVSFGNDTKIDHQDELGLVLQGDTLYGASESGYEHFFIEQGNFNVKSKKIQKVRDGEAVDDAVNKRQLDLVNDKADLNSTNLSTLTGRVDDLDTATGNNASDISDLRTDVDTNTGNIATVTSTANAADALSKENKGRLDNLPNIPNLDDYAKLDTDVSFTNVTVTDNVLFTDETGSDIVFAGFVDFKTDSEESIFTIGQGSVTSDVDINMKGSGIVNLVTGGDTDSSAANIGDVKRIATNAAGLKPVDSKWDMLNLPVVNVAVSEDVNSAATVGQLNTVEAKIPDVANFIETGTTAVLNGVMFGGDTKIDHQDELGLVLQGDTIYGKDKDGYEHFFVEQGNFNVKSKKIQKVNDGVADDDAATVRQVNIVSDVADAADTLSKANESLLADALLKDEYGWDVDNLNIYNVSRLSRTNNAVNSSGLSIGDVDVNLHGDTVGITSSNSATTYAVFTSGGLNLNDYPLTRMGSGGDTDSNAANIGDVKRIATSGSGLKPTDDKWDMLNLPVINVGESSEVTSAATVGQVNTVDSKADTAQGIAIEADTLSKDNKQRLDNLPPIPNTDDFVKNGEDVNFGTAEINIVKVTKADDKSKFSDILIDGNTNTEMNFVGDTHFYVRNKADNSKGAEAFQIDNTGRFIAKQKVKTPIVTNLSTGSTDSSSPNTGFIDLSTASKVRVGAKEDVTFSIDGNDAFKVTSDSIDFSDLGSKALIKQASGQVIDVSVGNVSNVEFTENGLKLTRDVDAHNQNLKNVGDIEHSDNAIILGKSTGNLKVRNVGQITRNSTNEANSVTLGNGENYYKSNTHNFLTNDDEDLIKIDSSGLHFRNTHEDSKGDTTIRVDSGNQNTVYDNIGLVYFNTIDKTSGEKKRIFLTSQNGLLVGQQLLTPTRKVLVLLIYVNQGKLS